MGVLCLRFQDSHMLQTVYIIFSIKLYHLSPLVLCHVIVFNTYKTLIKPTQRLALALASKQWPELVDQISKFGCRTLFKKTLGTGAAQPQGKKMWYNTLVLNEKSVGLILV